MIGLNTYWLGLIFKQLKSNIFGGQSATRDVVDEITDDPKPA